MTMTTSTTSTNRLPNPELLEFVTVQRLDSVEANLLQSAAKVYEITFGQPPYNDRYEKGEVIEKIFKTILDKGLGDLVIGTYDGEARSLAAGHMISDNTFHIDEVVVLPKYQGGRYGEATLLKLRAISQQTHPHAREDLRTTIENNDKAMGLYQKCGFVVVDGCEIVAQLRNTGKIGLDRRYRMSYPSLLDPLRTILKRLAVVSPSGNTTAVVFDQFSEEVDLPTLNQNIMDSWKAQKPDQPEIEQCCLVKESSYRDAVARVEMFGGEFCGNATRSAIWLLTKGDDYEGQIEVSGVARPLAFSVKDKEVTLEMPLPASGNLTKSADEGTLVYLDGITHLVVDADSVPHPRQLLDSLLKSNKYNCSEYPAFGVTLFERSTGESKFSVWVKKNGQTFDETACGSGTCAIGIVLANESRQSFNQNIKQPSGFDIRAIVDYQGDKIARVSIAGAVRVLTDLKFFRLGT